MELIDEIEEEIDKLKRNEYGFRVIKTKNKGIITTSIIIPEEIINKEISEMSIEFQLIIDTNSVKLVPKLYCVSPFCYPNLADGRDLFNELRSSKNPNNNNNWIANLLPDILEFIKINFEKGGLFFVGNYYLGAKYDLRLLQKGCENILNVRENLVINGKNVKINRVLVLSDVYFLLFEQEKWYKNNLTLLFWSSLSNIEKIQKVKDNKTLILQWTQKEKDTYPMSLTIQQRENFIERLLEKMHNFGMVFDVTQGNQNQIKKNLKKGDEISQSQNVKLINDYNKQELERNINNNEEEEEYEEGEEEEDDEENETNDKEKEKVKKEKDNKEKKDSVKIKVKDNDNNNINNNIDKKDETNNDNNDKNNNNNQDEENKNDDDDFIDVKESNNNIKEEIKTNENNNNENEIKEEKNEEKLNEEVKEKEEIKEEVKEEKKEDEKKEEEKKEEGNKEGENKVEEKKQDENKEEEKKEEDKKEEDKKEEEKIEEEKKEEDKTDIKVEDLKNLGEEVKEVKE